MIELLAIIVILAIIAVITVPIVLGVIEKCEKESIRSSAYGFMDAIKYNNAVAEMTPEQYIMISDGEYNITDSLFSNLQIEGTKPNGGEVIIEKKRVVSGCLQIDGYKVNIESGKVKELKKGVCYEPVIIHFDANGGSSVENQTKNVDKKVGVLPASERDNYALVGWFTEKTGGT